MDYRKEMERSSRHTVKGLCKDKFMEMTIYTCESSVKDTISMLGTQGPVRVECHY